MVLRHLLVGASALAFAATAASAQDNTVSINSTSSASPNNNNNSCVQGVGTNSNTCIITQNGTVNTASATQNGNGNYSLIDQRASAAGGAVTGNVATHVQVGDRNDARTTQRTNFNRSDVRQRSTAAVVGGVAQAGNQAVVTQQSGASNAADVQQVGRGQTATVTQAGANNSSTIIQGNYLDASGNEIANGQGGELNSATISQTGNNLRATIDQSGANAVVRNSQATINLFNNAGNFTTGSGQAGNTGYIQQTRADNTATVSVANGDAIGPQGGSAVNSGTVVQQFGRFNEASVSIGNPVNGALASQNSTGTVNQTSTGGRNYAEVTITGGVSGGDPVADPSVGADTNTLSGGNRATVNQTGSQGFSTALVTVAKLRDFQSLGNVVTVNQNATAGYNGSASPSQGSAATADRIAVSEPAYDRALSAAGQYVSTYSQGRFGTIIVNQSDNAGSGAVYQDAQGGTTGVARSRANIFQAGEQFNANVTQAGDNYADITQGRLGSSNQPTDRRGRVTLNQTDAGDGAVTQTGTTPVVNGFDQFGNPTTSGGNPVFGGPGRQYNTFVASQYGLGNQVDATQNARDAFMNVFQGTNSAGTAAVAEGSTQPTGLTADLRQGTGDTSAFIGQASGNPGLPGTYAPPLQAGFAANGSGLNAGANSVSATLNFKQGGTNNATQSYQDSSNSVINITQLGSSPFNGVSFVDQGQQASNYVGVAQQGTNNRATAIQNSTVGRSTGTTGTATAASPQSGNSAAQNVIITGNPNAPADDFFFAGGARSSQIVILQGGTGNKARAEQNGLGQNARIEQAGTNNEAGILQGVNATNATAIIRQAGSGNTYYANQTQAGQYVAVDQYGTNNSSNQVIFRGPADGNSGFTQPAGFPGF